MMELFWLGCSPSEARLKNPVLSGGEAAVQDWLQRAIKSQNLNIPLFDDLGWKMLFKLSAQVK